MVFGRLKSDYALWGILTLFVLLGVIYSLTLPIFEAADEISHFRVVEFMADNRAIPHTIEDAEQVGHESGQPPLYYALLAPFIRPIDRSDFNEAVSVNPHFTHLNSNQVWYHHPDRPSAWQGVQLAVYLGRIISVLIASFTVWGTWATAKIISQEWELPEEFAILAAGLVAFNPQFLAISGSINNDNLVILFCTTALWLAVRWQETQENKWHPFLIGVTVGFAVLSKVSGLAFGIIIAWILLRKWWRSGRLWPAFLDGLLVLAGLFVTAGWWFVRNQQLYGDPLGLGALRFAHAGTYRDIPLTWLQTLAESQLILKTFWLFPGNGTLFGPNWFYWVINIAIFIGVLGVIARITALREVQLIGLSIWVGTVAALLFYWISTVGATSQGRLLYPALSSMMILVLAGFWHLGLPGRWAARSIVLFLLVAAAATPFLITVPAFAAPSPLKNNAEIPNRFGEPQMVESIELLGHENTVLNLSVGDQPSVKLYWQASSPINKSYFVTLHFVDIAGKEVSRYEGYPFQGRYPTNLWGINEPFVEEIVLPPISENAEPGLATVFIDLTSWDGVTSTELRPLAVQSKIRIDDNQSGLPEVPLEAKFDSLAVLEGYTLKLSTNNLTVDLHWLAENRSETSQTVFVHLINSAGELLQQADSVPRLGTYPTNYWEPGEKILDTHQLPIDGLPQGDYTVAIGFYDPISGQRIPIKIEGQDSRTEFLISLQIK